MCNHFVIGVTGPSGSGKSFVLNHWAERGVMPIHADAVYHALLENDTDLRRAVVERFGTADRRVLARVVFSDPQSLRDLEAITHPAVITAVKKQLSAVDCQQPVALEAIALFESGLDALCAATVTVVANDALRLRRLVARDSRPEQDIRARMDAGQPASWYTARANHILDGNSVNLAQDAITLLDEILCK